MAKGKCKNNLNKLQKVGTLAYIDTGRHFGHKIAQDTWSKLSEERVGKPENSWMPICCRVFDSRCWPNQSSSICQKFCAETW